jgi:transcriptional regulator with XRE-family HTH domain
MKIILNNQLVEKERKRNKLTVQQLCDLMGITRAGYYDMMKRRSISRSEQIARLFSMDENLFVIRE